MTLIFGTAWFLAMHTPKVHTLFQNLTKQITQIRANPLFLFHMSVMMTNRPTYIYYQHHGCFNHLLFVLTLQFPATKAPTPAIQPKPTAHLLRRGYTLHFFRICAWWKILKTTTTQKEGMYSITYSSSVTVFILNTEPGITGALGPRQKHNEMPDHTHSVYSST